jgi:hypothetical protein
MYLLIPNQALHRPQIRACPFSTDLVLDRGNKDWLAVMDTRFFLYPVHISHTFLLTPTQSSAVYLIFLRLLARQYAHAFQVVQSCEADVKLRDDESWVLKQLEKTQEDVHPDAHATRLKLSLVIMHSGEKFPWRLQEEYMGYCDKLALVSRSCRLSVDEEYYLLKHIESGAELEEVEEVDEKNELAYKGIYEHH